MGKMDFVENFSQHIDIRLIYKKMFSSSGSYKLFSYNLNLISKTEWISTLNAAWPTPAQYLILC